MRDGTNSLLRLLLSGVTATAILAAPTSPAQTKHIIQFGGSFGFAYSPSTLSVSVGDIVEWQGDFITHPLSSTTIPAGAPSWHNGTGTVFDYVVGVAGTYNYQCDVHGSGGMVGSFVAAATGVDNEQNSGQPASFRLGQNFPNPFNPSTTIRFELPRASWVTLKVYNALGEEVAALVDGVKPAGQHEVKFEGSALPSGVYFYRLQAGTFVATKRLVVLK
jgi:plastocyanin